MPSTLREAVRERLTLRSVAAFLVAVAMLRVVVDASVPQLAVTALLSLVAGSADVAREVYGVRESVASGWAGAVAVIGSLGLLAFDGGPVWFSVLFLLAGAWFLLDAVQTARHEGLTEDELTGREVYRDYVGRRVEESLEARPRTRRELFDTLDADDETVEAALARLQERGVAEQEGSEFRLREDEDAGALARVRGGVVGLARRIARPVTLELGSAGDEDGDRSLSPRSEPPRESPRRTDARESDTDGEREDEGDRERAREPAE